MNHLLKTAFKRSITFLGFMLMIMTSSAQTSKFSLSFNSLTTNFNYGRSNSTVRPYKKNFRGLELGAAYQAGITKHFSIVPALYFAVKGGVLQENNPLAINKSTLRLYTLDLPVLVRLHLHNLYFDAGPYAGYNLGGRQKIEGSGILPGKTTAINFGDGSGDFKRWDLGVQAGGGYNFNLKRSILTLDARYGYGLVNISKEIQRYNRMLNISLVLSKLGNVKS